MEENKELEQRVRGIENDCLNGKLHPILAAEEIDRAIGGITRVEYKPGLKFKIDNHTKRVGLDFKGYTNRQTERLYDLAIATYMKAQSGEIHLSKGLSSKHYMQGIRDAYTRMQATLATSY